MSNLLRNLAVPAAMALAVTAVAVHSQDNAPPKLASVVTEYAKAWISKDADRIAARHSEESEFVLNISGTKPAKGKAAIRAQFAQILSDNPAYASTVRSIDFGETFVVIEYSFKMKPSGPFDLGRHRLKPDGTAFDVPAIDVIHFKDGLVTAKHTYMDSEAVRDHAKVVKSAAPLK
jgi:ketosteroid isomerase-like protein